MTNIFLEYRIFIYLSCDSHPINAPASCSLAIISFITKPFMKKLLPFLTLFFISCQKENDTKIAVCHFDAVTGLSKTILVSQNALTAHLAHGDIQGDCSATLTTTICNQVWMVRNLEVTAYKNGDPIPHVTDPSDWAALTTGAWCYYDYDAPSGVIYGKLYNWYAINDPRGLAPTGWHVPDDTEWITLADCLGGELIAGGKMKEAGLAHWWEPNVEATNSSGFTGLPGGLRYDAGPSNINGFAFFWSSTERSATEAGARWLGFGNADLLGGGFNKVYGLSVRCIRDRN